MPNKSDSFAHPFETGEEVVIASRAEILSSIDAQGNLDGMPVMPQMLDLCGTRHTIYRRADKTCDTIDGTGGRRLHDTVHLDGVRCDGKAYGGCQAGCLIFWKERWLRRDGQHPTAASEPEGAATAISEGTCAQGEADTRVYRCQATELVRASEPLAWWDLRQYWRDWRKNDIALRDMARAFSFWLLRCSLRLGAYNLQVRLFNRWQKFRGARPYPFETGCQTRTPSRLLDLQLGEVVRVRSHEDIVATLDSHNRNRGLCFDAEMVKFCGGIFRVQQRVTKIIDERSGKMLNFGSPGIILENVFCTARISPGRLFCPRAIHHYWREIWLERIDAAPE